MPIGLHDCKSPASGASEITLNTSTLSDGTEVYEASDLWPCFWAPAQLTESIDKKQIQISLINISGLYSPLLYRESCGGKGGPGDLEQYFMMLDEQKYMREILTDYFMKSSKKNPRISWRSFAKKLGISSSALSEIMSGKRKVSFKKAQELGEKLGISDNEMQRLAQLFQQKPGIRGLEKVSNPFREKVLAKNEWNLHADWRYFAIVALMRTKNFRSDRKWMAERLNLEVSEVKNLISDLASLGVVKEDARGDLTETKTAFRTPLDYPEELFQKRMLEGLGAACRAVEDKASGHVGYYSTISLDPAKLPEAAAMMEDFLKRLSLFLHEGEPREVFELHLQLFPRTTGKS